MANPSRRRNDKVVAMPTAMPSPIDVTPAAEVTEQEIALRAFELYCERGREDGHDLEDWLRAEAELRGEASVTAA